MNLPQFPVVKITEKKSHSFADYSLIGVTKSLCPVCMEVVDAKVIVRGKRVYLRKRCPSHGVREDYVCSDVNWWDRGDVATPAKLPRQRSTDVRRGCPHDCGLCEDHEQHTCIGLVELTDRCNLTCPMCFASSSPGAAGHSLDEILASLDRLVACEGRAEVCQLSGGEPTLHPEFRRVVEEALARPIDYVMINTNGIRLAKDPSLVDFLAERKDRVEIYLQWDGRNSDYQQSLRGENLTEVKQRCLDALETVGLNVTLTATLAAPIPLGIYRDLMNEARKRRNVTGLSLQPATYSGRHLTPQDLDQRVTFPDCIRGLAEASDGMVEEEDFLPLPCAHPNCHQIMLAVREGDRFHPLARSEGFADNLDLIAGGISFTPERSKELVEAFLARQSHCGSDCGCHEIGSTGKPSGSEDSPILQRFFEKVLLGQASSKDLLRITITSFLDAYNFDIRQLMKCCTHHVLPSGHIIPFCAYNTLYRPGHLPLPPLR